MTSYLKYYIGYLTVELYSPTPERFFNICYANNINISNILYHDNFYTFVIPTNEFFNLKPILKKTNSKTKIKIKTGIRSFIVKYRKHNCFVLGIMLSTFLIYLMTLFLWDINISGNSMITNDVILDTLYDNGIYYGIFMKNINCDIVEKILRKEFNDITWISVEKNGTRISIYIKENDEDYVDSKFTECCDIVATCDGVIEYIITRTGTPLKKIGDEVHTGDIIVSGNVNIYDDYGVIVGANKVIADADLLISSKIDYIDNIKIDYKYKLFTGKNKKMLYINIFDKYFLTNIGKKYDYFDSYIDDHQIHIGKNLYLPIHYGIKNEIEYINQNAKYTENQANTIFEDRLNYYLKELAEKGVQIISKDVKISKNFKEYSYKGEINILTPQYEKVPIIE